jgi:hypothetical protein
MGTPLQTGETPVLPLEIAFKLARSLVTFSVDLTNTRWYGLVENIIPGIAKSLFAGS